MAGFYIKKLKLCGDGKKDAEIIFEKGLNVIHGPSNTGKSYIFQCINYALGSSEIKNIPESKGYSELYLEIRNIDNDDPITILRFLNNKKIFYYICNIEDTKYNNGIELNNKHDPTNDNNISKFLLKQIGITENKYLVKNKYGKKATLSFRAIAHLSIISETDIISESKSPVLEEQNTQQTYSKSVFRYLLTNKDDIDCEELEKSEFIKAKNEAKINYVEEEITYLMEERKKFINEREKFNINDVHMLDYYKDKIIEIEQDIKLKRQELHDINTLNNKLNLQKSRTQMMLDKFNLLKIQYISDIDRLDFISDGDSLLSQIETYNCPLCNSEVNRSNEIIYDDMVNCCNNEKNKIKVNLNELEISINELNRELRKINKMLFLGEKKSKKYSEEIMQISSKDLKSLRSLIKELIKKSNIDRRISDIESIIERKRAEIIEFKKNKKVKENSVTDRLVVDEHIYNELCEEIKNSLISCGYSEIEEVSFNVKIQDIETNGVQRLSNGKGYRAFLYAIFSAALMIYLNKLGHPFMNVLVLDSPLTTLKESEIGELKEDDFIDNSLQDGFFEFFANKFNDKQVIIIDNKQPPKSLLGKYNDIIFTKGRSKGRYGFFENI